jgi:ectoine hydroxylase-related dioxygenase (phytanoyl-CoA dioxygenase family)
MADEHANAGPGTSIVSDDLVDSYRRDGAVVVRNAIDKTWLERLGAAIERDIADPGPFNHSYDVEGGRFHGNLRIWQNDQDFGQFCLRGPAIELARQFTDASRLNLLYDQLFVKEAGADHPTRWHNDQPYWPVSGRDVVSVWVALDHVDAANGRLEFIRGSHLWDRWFQPESFGPNRGASLYERNPEYEIIPDIEADRDAYDIITWDVEPGDVYVFNGMTLHHAGGNSTADRRRRGYTVRYCGDDVRYEPRVGISQPILVDGLQAGDLLDSEQCPVVYPAPA